LLLEFLLLLLFPEADDVKQRIPTNQQRKTVKTILVMQKAIDGDD